MGTEHHGRSAERGIGPGDHSQDICHSHLPTVGNFLLPGLNVGSVDRLKARFPKLLSDIVRCPRKAIAAETAALHDRISQHTGVSRQLFRQIFRWQLCDSRGRNQTLPSNR